MPGGRGFVKGCVGAVQIMKRASGYVLCGALRGCASLCGVVQGCEGLCRVVQFIPVSIAEEWQSSSLHVCSFGKGSFKLCKDGDDKETNFVEWKVTSHEDLVVFQGAQTTIGQLVNEQRKKKPDDGIAYHKMESDPTNPLAFKLVQTHKVSPGEPTTSLYSMHTRTQTFLLSLILIQTVSICTEIYHMEPLPKNISSER